MRTAELAKQAARIRALIGATKKATDGELELQAHWAKYLCVLVAGFIENSLQMLFIDYVNNSSPTSVARFAVEKIRAIQNPRPARFVEIAKAFKEDWGENLDRYLRTDGRDDAINAIMTGRHQIAHGKDSDITIYRVSSYFDKAIEVAEYVERQLGVL